MRSLHFILITACLFLFSCTTQNTIIKKDETVVEDETVMEDSTANENKKYRQKILNDFLKGVDEFGHLVDYTAAHPCFSLGSCKSRHNEDPIKAAHKLLSDVGLVEELTLYSELQGLCGRMGGIMLFQLRKKIPGGDRFIEEFILEMSKYGNFSNIEEYTNDCIEISDNYFSLKTLFHDRHGDASEL